MYKLKKVLYGLKQAPRVYSQINAYFNEKGFKRNLNKLTLYVEKKSNDILIISLYVNDLIIIGNNENMILVFKSDIKRYEINYMDFLDYFFGIEINQRKHGNFICQ